MELNIGLSFSVEFLSGLSGKGGEKTLLEKYRTPGCFLERLKEKGVTHIELHNAYPDSDQKSVLDAVKAVWSKGMKMTLHGCLKESFAEKSLLEIYPSITGILRNMPDYQEQIPLTTHTYSGGNENPDALSARTEKTVSCWAQMIEKEALPLFIAVELNRAKGLADPSVTCDGVMRIVNAVGHRRVGVCWDMGHYYENFKNGIAAEMPTEDFVKKTVHTHIHGIGEKGTHCPIVLSRDQFLVSYLRRLKEAGYSGIYNLEFVFSKFPPDVAIDTAVFRSIDHFRSLLEILGRNSCRI